MTQKAIRTLLLSKTKPVQLAIALTGAMLGLVIVMSGLQLYRDIEAVMAQKEMLGGDYIVISKQVGILNTISGSHPGFDAEEINEIKGVKGIDKVGAFESGTFRAVMELDPKYSQMVGPAFKTDMFFESIPDEFVDADASRWRWSPEDDVVPIIISSDYLSLYNDAFAQSQGLPVVPESMIKSITLQLVLKGEHGDQRLRGRIAGFSQRVNSILVPRAFVNWANQKFGTGESRKPARLILHASDPANPQLMSFFSKHGYKLNEEKLKASRTNTILRLVLLVVAGFGGLIVILALLGFMQYNQLLAYRSAYEIQSLHWLGYTVSQLAQPYIRFVFASLAIVFVPALILLFGMRHYISSMLQEKGFEASLPGMSVSIAAGVVISLLMASLSALAARRQVARLAR